MPGPHLFTSLGAVGKAGLGATVAAAGVLGAGAAGALPGPADDAVRSAIETVSPVDFDASDDSPERFGGQVSADATGASDGENGVDGPSVAATAPGAQHRADDAAPDDPPGTTGETGLTRANQTPAAPHAPEVAPSTVPAPGGPADPGVGAGADADNGDRPDPVPSTVPPRGGQADGHQPAG